MLALVASALFDGVLPAMATTPCSVTDQQSGTTYTDLQVAIDAASAGDTLQVTGTCTGPFTIPKDLTLLGSGGATLTGGGGGTVLTIVSSDAGLEGITIANNDIGIRNQGGGTLTLSSSAVTGAPGDGGGIVNWSGGTLILVDSTISGNEAPDADGGGIYNAGTATITNSTVSGNYVEYLGAGIFNDGGTMIVTDSSVTGNVSDQGDGGGIVNSGTLTITNSSVSGNYADEGGGISNFGTLTLTNSTVSGNRAGDAPGGGVYSSSGAVTATNSTVSGNSAWVGGGIYEEPGGTVTLSATILAGNTAAGWPDCGGSFTSGGYNLVGDATGCTAAWVASDQVGPISGSPLDPNLAALADKGGPTETMALYLGSPAIDQIPPGQCTAFLGQDPTDQRGIARPIGTTCDIGAYEGEIPDTRQVDVSVGGTASPGSVTADGSLTYTLSVANAGPKTGTAVTLTDVLPAGVILGSVTTTRGACPGTTTVTCTLGTMTAGASATVTIILTPIAPGTITDTATVSANEPDSNTANNSVSLQTAVLAEKGTKYVAVTDSGFSPKSRSAPQGNWVQWNFLGPSAHSATDTTGMGLFSSGAKAPVAYYRFRFVAAGTYPYADSPGKAKGKIKVPIKVSPKSGLVNFTYTITWAKTQAPSGYAYDVQVKRPNSSKLVAWKTGVNVYKASFNPNAGAGAYSFRARIWKISNGAGSDWSPAKAITVSQDVKGARSRRRGSRARP